MSLQNLVLKWNERNILREQWQVILDKIILEMYPFVYYFSQRAFHYA